MVRILKEGKMEQGTVTEELPSLETQGEPCVICGERLPAVAKPARSHGNLLALDLRTKLEGDSSTESSTSRQADQPVKTPSLCTSCSTLLSKYRSFTAQAKKTENELRAAWRNSKVKKIPGHLAAFVKCEHGKREAALNAFGDIPEDLSDFGMVVNSLQDGVCQDSDKNRFKRKRSSEHSSSDNLKRSSSKCRSTDPYHIMQTENFSAESLISPCWVCHLCNATFNETYSAKEHIQETHNVYSSNTAEVLPYNIKNVRVRNVPAYDQQDNDAFERNLLCPICNVRCKNRLSLLQHLDHINTQIVCAICNISCATQNELENHQFVHVSVVQASECMVCQESFSDNIFFECHKEYCFLENSPIPQPFLTWSGTLTCTLCKKCDIRSTDITEHLLRHRGTCRVCFKQFEVNHGLAIHSAKHHKAHLFYCKRCPDIFTSREKLQDHLNAHTNGEISPTFCITMPKKVTPEQEHQDKKTIMHCNSDLKYCSSRKFCTDYETRDTSNSKIHFAHAAATSINEGKKEPNILPNYATATCENSYTHQNHLKPHESEVHKGMKQEVGRSPLSSLTSADVESTLQCLQCDASSPSQSVERHANTNSSFQSAPVRTQSPMFQNKFSYCDQCSYSTNSPKGLKIHKARKHIKLEGNLKISQPKTPKINASFLQYNGQNYYTNEPNQSYRPVEKFSNLLDFSGKESIVADQAQYQTNYHQPIMTRLKTAIPQENWKCQICSKSFKTNRGLSQHIAWHTRKEAQAVAASNARLQYHIAAANVGNPSWDVSGMQPTVGKQEDVRTSTMWHGGEMLATTGNQEPVRPNTMWDAAGGMIAPLRNQEAVRTLSTWDAGETVATVGKQEKISNQPSTDAGNAHRIFHHPWETPAPAQAPDVKQSRRNEDREQTDETLVVPQNIESYTTGNLQESRGMSEEQSTPVRLMRKRSIPDDASWKCNKCKKHFKSKEIYLDHKKSHSSADQHLVLNTSNDDSGLELTETAFQMICQEMFHKCPNCQDLFFYKEDLEMHMKSHGTNPKESYPDGGKFNCLFCSTRIKHSKAFATHLITHGMKCKRFFNIQSSSI